jgi:prepilin-type N-terminal cleavage/methylation domain-containing protein
MVVGSPALYRRRIDDRAPMGDSRQEQIRDACRRGFTLIELLMIVVILGLLAALVIPQFTNSSDDAARVAFITSGRTFVEAARRYHLDHGEYPEDAGSGFLPDGFGLYVQSNRWVGGTPIGGVWDSVNNTFGTTSAMGVHFNGAGESRDDAYMQQIDDAVDDGDLATGWFQKLGGNRYYFIVAP